MCVEYDLAHLSNLYPTFTAMRSTHSATSPQAALISSHPTVGLPPSLNPLIVPTVILLPVDALELADPEAVPDPLPPSPEATSGTCPIQGQFSRVMILVVNAVSRMSTATKLPHLVLFFSLIFISIWVLIYSWFFVAIDKPWWSVNYGPVHFTFMSTEHNFSIGSEQYQYLSISSNFLSKILNLNLMLIL